MSAHQFLQSGDFNVRMSVEALEKTNDGCGGFQEIWVPKFEVWVRLIPVDGIKLIRADAVENQITHWIYLRKRPDVFSGMRLVANSRTFVIETVRDPDESGRYLFCEAKEIQ